MMKIAMTSHKRANIANPIFMATPLVSAQRGVAVRFTIRHHLAGDLV